jgi:protein-S-isoprenylcysteine O-methyltransferase Ste14
MSLIPAFEIGIWNAWIFMVLLFLIPTIAMYAKSGIFKKTEASAKFSRAERRVFIISKIVLMLTFLYSIFLPLKLGTAWFYTGLPISLLGIVLYIVVSVNITSTPVNEPVTRGIYRYSRHPMYVFGFLAPLGAGIAAASWLFILLTVILIITHCMNGIPEERSCLDAYGDAYRDYMAMTPRWIGIPKSG